MAEKIENVQDNQATKNTDVNRDDGFRLQQLNDHCLLKIFSYLWPIDADNLAKTSPRLKDLSLYPVRKMLFRFHSDMASRTTDQNATELDRLLDKYGEHIKSWSLTLENKGGKFDRGVEVLRRVSQYCTNLKKLKMMYECDLTEFVAACGESAACFENVEYLICQSCGESLNLDFLRLFRNLKHIHFDMSGTKVTNLQILFKNNPGIESFNVENGQYAFGGGDDCDETFSNQFNLCEFGPKFQTLCLKATREVVDMGAMQRLAATNLTKFKLDTACAVDLNIFLDHLAKTGNLKELELYSIQFDLAWVDALQSFQNLELLVVRPHTAFEQGYPNMLPVVWPPNLRYLSTNIVLTLADFLSTIQQLNRLQRLKLSQDTEIFLDRQWLQAMLANIFYMKVQRPILQFTVGLSDLAIIHFQRERVLCNISSSTYRKLRIVPADYNNSIGIDFSVHNYVDEAPTDRFYNGPAMKIRRLMVAGSSSMR